MNKDDFGRFSGSLQFNRIEFNPDAIPAPDTLHIRMTRGERRIADELRKQFGGFGRVIIDVDGERHEFDADSLIRMLEGYEGSRDEKLYDAGFDNGMKAVLQQLDGLIHEGADVDEIQAWADRQWEEEA